MNALACCGSVNCVFYNKIDDIILGGICDGTARYQMVNHMPLQPVEAVSAKTRIAFFEGDRLPFIGAQGALEQVAVSVKTQYAAFSLDHHFAHREAMVLRWMIH